MSIRIERLARELGVGIDDVLALLQRLGQSRYKDGTQQLKPDTEALVRRHARDLARPRPAAPVTDPRPVRRLDLPPPPREDVDALTRAFAGVAPIARAAAGASPGAGRGKPAARKAGSTPTRAPAAAPPPPGAAAAPPPPGAAAPSAVLPASTAPPSTAPPPGAAAPSALLPASTTPPSTAPPEPAPPAGALRPPARPDPGALQLAALLQSLARAEGEIAAERARVEGLEAARAGLEEQLREAAVQRDALRMALVEGEKALRAERDRAEALAAELAALRSGGGEAPRPAAVPEPAEPVRTPDPVLAPAALPTTLRVALERRGLRGESELAQALAALAGAPRLRDLLDQIGLADAEAVAVWLEERLALVAQDEDPPPGTVGVRVPPERSESPAAPVTRAALERLATACLVNGRRRLYVIGGGPAARRTLRDGLDPRIDVRFADPHRLGTPLPGSLVICWGPEAARLAAGRFPGAATVDAVAVAPLVAAAVDALSRE